MLSTPTTTSTSSLETLGSASLEDTSRVASSNLGAWADTAGGSVPIVEFVPPRETSLVQMVANLDALSPAPSQNWDVTDPSGTANFVVPVTLFDARGRRHVMDVCFRRLETSEFEYFALLPGECLQGGTAGIMVVVGEGNLCFDSDGALLAVTERLAIEVFFRDSEECQCIRLDFGQSRDDGGMGEDGVTAYAMPSYSSFQSQDGYMGGRFATLEVSSSDTVYAVYTNGQKLPLLEMA